jgi:hypothetical protein
MGDEETKGEWRMSKILKHCKGDDNEEEGNNNISR